MRKLFYIFCLLYCLSASSQTLYVARDTLAYSTEGTATEAERPKVHFPKNLKEKYGADFDYTEKNKTENWWAHFKDWMGRWLSRMFSAGKSAPAGLVDLVLNILGAIFILVVAFLIVKAILNKEGQWVFGKNSDRRLIRFDEYEQKPEKADFKSLIADATRKGQRRLAVRFYYLWLLRQMAQRELIEWDIEKTNADYLNEIADEELRERFAYLSYLYNYIWYGDFTVSELIFERTVNAFEKTIKSL